MKKQEKIMMAVNLIWIAVIFVLNYFYQSNGFAFILKCICSGLFVLLGLVNCGYAVLTKSPERRFCVSMLCGLFFAFLGDVLIGYNFIIGAAVFALGHVCFVIAYGFLRRFYLLDCIISGVLFAGAAVFLMFSPLLSFDVPVFRIVCLVYALIISAMLGKSIGNAVMIRNSCTKLLAAGSALFFFSDLMLVFDWFIGRWDWTDHACMGTYYPALCLLALSVFIHTINHKTHRKEI
jgi:uncharacterized membrane protein YhhN